MSALTDPFLLDRPAVRNLRGLLDAVGYGKDGILEALGLSDMASGRINRRSTPVLLRRVPGDSPREVLIRLFLLGLPQPAAVVDAAIQPLGVAELERLGLVALDGNDARPTVKLRPIDAQLLATDDFPPAGAEPVMSLGGSTFSTAQFTVRRPVTATLDLGSGCGAQAFLAAAHAERVVGIDRNPRAVNHGRFNALLNGLDNVEFRCGSWFEPVAGESFGLIVGNPPYVMSPRQTLVYRESGMPADQVCESLVRALPGHLEEGGFGGLEMQWAIQPGQDWRDRLRGWLEGSGCDALMLQLDEIDPATYASAWIPDPIVDSPEPGVYEREFADWLAYFERERIIGIGHGFLTLRKRTGGANWFHVDAAAPRSGSCSNAIQATFAAQDFLQSKPDPISLLRSRFVLAPGVLWQEEARPGSSGWSVTSVRLRLPDGLRYDIAIDRNLLAMLNECRDGRTLSVAIGAAAQALGQPMGRVPPESLAVVRVLVSRGFLIPIGE